MQNSSFYGRVAGVVAASCGALALAGVAAAVVPSRIVQAIDERDAVVLTGNTAPLAGPGQDAGRADPSQQMPHMNLLLKRSAEQEQALAAFNERQTDANSPDYHHWLHAEEFAAMYGPSDADIAAVLRWLRSGGFHVQQVSQGKISIEFSGTVAQVERAFGVQMHRYLVGGIQHVANDRDPQIPRALFPIVSGVAALNDFRQAPQMVQGGFVSRDTATGKITPIEGPDGAGPSRSTLLGLDSPQLVSSGSTGPTQDLTPYDFATIYNLLPLWTAATPINGTGVAVAIAGQSDITLSDVATYRSVFGLPAKVPTIIHNGADPGLVTGDRSEQTLDVEMVGAAAPGADITLVVTSTSTTGVLGSAQYIVDHEIAPIMSMSYGECELFEGQAVTSLVNSIWQQGVTEGISIFVSSGDSGSAMCSSGNQQAPTADTHGVQVNGNASSPYVTAVGGTDFVWDFLKNGETTYWNTADGAHDATAKGYVPEMVWNTGCANPLLREYAFISSAPIYATSEALCNGILKTAYLGIDFALLENIAGGGGGESHCTTPTGTTCAGGWPKPAWQKGTGVPADAKRDVPDVSLFSAIWLYGPVNWGGSAILVCDSSSHPCNYGSPGTVVFQQIGGTSAASPYMAGVMALVVQKMGGTLQGLANPTFYKLAATDNLTTCNSLTVAAGNTCVFHDVVTGSNAQPCTTGDSGCVTSTSGDKLGILSGYNAATGYDQATGLGSVNAANLVNAWASAAPVPAVSILPASLVFSPRAVDSASAAQIVTIKNTGTVAATFKSGGITVTGTGASSFTHTTTCGASLALGASCTVSITFKPTVAGSLAAKLSIADNAAGSPQTVALSETGVAVSVTPASIAFPNTVIAATSDEQVVTLSNTGTTAVTIGAIALAGTSPTSFLELNNCGASLAAASSCAIYIAFHPAKAGALSATLTVTDSSGLPQVVTLTGIGTAAPSVKLSVASIVFPATTHGTTSAAHAVTVTNAGTATLDLASIALTGTNPTDFEELNNCAATLAAGASCTIYAAFKPAAAAAYKANLSVADSGAASPQLVTLSGSGK